MGATLSGTLPSIRSHNVDAVYRQMKQPIDGLVGLKFFPIKEIRKEDVVYDVYQAATGLMKPTGENAPAPKIQFTKLDEVTLRPVTFKESYEIVGQDIVFVKQDKDYAREYLANALKNLKIRELSRIEWSIWQALTGTLSIDENGVTRTVTYSGIQTFSASNSWATSSTDIVGDLVTIMKLYRGTGARPRYMICNQTVAGYLLKNDTFEAYYSNSGLAPIDGVKRFLTSLGLELIVYDGGYINSSGTFVPYIGEDKVFFIGEGPYPPGHFFSTLTIEGPTMTPRPGEFARIKEDTDGDPKKIQVIAGIRGLPGIVFPSWIVYADVVP